MSDEQLSLFDEESILSCMGSEQGSAETEVASVIRKLEILNPLERQAVVDLLKREAKRIEDEMQCIVASSDE